MSNRTETIYKQRNKYFQIELRWYEWNRPGWVILCCLGFFVCFLVRLVRKVLLKEMTFDPGKWVKHLTSIVACTPRVPLEVGVGCLKASEITRMTYLWPILIQNKCSPFLNKQRKEGLTPRENYFPASVKSTACSNQVAFQMLWSGGTQAPGPKGWIGYTPDPLRQQPACICVYITVCK